MSERFFTKINKKGRNVIMDKECNIEIIDLTLACEVLNRLNLKLKHYNEVNGEQQATINILLEELVNAQQQGYVIGFLHKNEHCSLIPKELKDE